MKMKIMSAIAAAVMCCGMFAGCTGDSAPDGSGGKKKAISIYSTGEDYRNENARKMLTEHFPEYDITLTDIGTGALAAKLAAEGKDSDIDIIMELETS